MMKYSIVITCVDACSSLYAYACKWAVRGGRGRGGIGRRQIRHWLMQEKGKEGRKIMDPHPPPPLPPSTPSSFAPPLPIHPPTPFPPLFFWMNKRKLKLVSPAVKTEKTPKPRNKPQSRTLHRHGRRPFTLSLCSARLVWRDVLWASAVHTKFDPVSCFKDGKKQFAWLPHCFQTISAT